MHRAAHFLKFSIPIHLALMLACALLCTLLGQGHSTRHLNKWLSAASSTSLSQLSARAVDLSTDGIVALEPQTQATGSKPLTRVLEVKFLLIQWSALLYRTPVIGWIHRLQKLEDGWRTGGLSRWLSLLDFAVETALLLMSKEGARGVSWKFNLFNLTPDSWNPGFFMRNFYFLSLYNRISSKIQFVPSSRPTLVFTPFIRLAHPLRPF